MKIFVSLLVFVRGQYAPTNFPDTTTGDSSGSDIACWHCDAVNMTECDNIGAMKPCLGENQVCMIEVRKREGELEQVRKLASATCLPKNRLTDRFFFIR